MSKLFPNLQEEARTFRSSVSKCFPRRIRNNLVGGMESNKVLHYICSEAEKRANRLLGSLYSLKREISHSQSTSIADYNVLKRDEQRWLETNKENSLRPIRRKRMWDLLNRARQISVDEDILTSDFRRAREPEKSESESSFPNKWRIFQELREARNSWGEALQIAPDWDSQKMLSQSLRRLFIVRVNSTDVHTGEARGGAGDDASILCAEFTVARIPKEIRIVFKSQETGESTLRIIPIQNSLLSGMPSDDDRYELDELSFPALNRFALLSGRGEIN